MISGIHVTHDGIVIPSNRLAAWAGFPLTDPETSRLADALSESTLPEVIGSITAEFRHTEDGPDI